MGTWTIHVQYKEKNIVQRNVNYDLLLAVFPTHLIQRYYNLPYD